jgi:TetR/AcrR family transcriptional regulator, upper aerobic nicotinate degradation pathway regulator
MPFLCGHSMNKRKPRSDSDSSTSTPSTSKKALAAPGAVGLPTRPARRRSPEEVQARILAAATAEFAEHSYSGARIDRISKRAKTVDRMLYYYFGSKERLYQVVLEKGYADLIAAQRNFSFEAVDPVQGMRDLVRQSWRHYLNHPQLVRLLVTENLLRAKYLRKSATIKGTVMPLIERANALLRTGQEAGLFRRDADAHRVLMTVMSLGFFYLSNQFTTGYWLGVDLMDPEHLQAWEAHICDVVLDHLTRRA